MGVVFKARERSSNRLAAIKTLHPMSANDSVQTRFHVEGKLLSTLRHPNIVTLLDFGTASDSTPYMVLEFIDGKTLAEVLAEEGQLATERIIDIFLQVCDALAHAHAHKILHRDIKPSNLMLMSRQGVERVYLTDFGIGKLLSDPGGDRQKITQTGQMIGTPTYMSPEQAQGKKLDERSDLYSLGCVMYEALTGSPPFISRSLLGTVLQHQRETPLSIPEASMGRAVDPRLQAIVIKLLEKDPVRRFQSAQELRKSLDETRTASDTVRLQVTAAPAGKLSPQARKSNALQLVPLLIIFVTAAILATIMFTRVAWKRGKAPSPPSAAPGQITATDAATIQSIASKSRLPAAVEPSKNSVPGVFPAVDEEDGRTREKIVKAINEKAEILNIGATAVESLHPVTDEDLALMKDATHLRIVRLDRPDMTDQGLESLSKLHLAILSLVGCKVKSLHALSNMYTLQQLDLKRTNIDPKTLLSLQHLPNLQRLSLDSTDIKDQDLPYLYGLKQLKLLSLLHCTLSEQQVDALRKQLPGCMVLRERGAPGGTGLPSGTFYQLVSEGDKLLAAKQMEQALLKYEQAASVCDLDPTVTSLMRMHRILANSDLSVAIYCKLLLPTAEQQNQLAVHGLDPLKKIELDVDAPVPSLMAEVYAREAVIYKLLGQHSYVQRCAETAARQFDRADPDLTNNDSLWQPRRLNNLALLAESYLWQRDAANAEKAYERLTPLASKLKASRLRAKIALGIANLLVRNEKRVAALDYYRQAEQLMMRDDRKNKYLPTVSYQIALGESVTKNRDNLLDAEQRLSSLLQQEDKGLRARADELLIVVRRRLADRSRNPADTQRKLGNTAH
jgi:serine/threonine-protein kinase